jgi:hypothetical protein
MDRGDGSVELKFRETFVDERRSGLGTVEQYPVVLCFAMSLSKAQVTEILWDESMLLSLVATIEDGESPIAGGGGMTAMLPHTLGFRESYRPTN